MPTAPLFSAEPDRFDEAMDEFLSRRLMSRDEANELQDYARRRAFWISGVAQLDIVRQAHESIADAMERGIPFEEWQKGIESKLTEAWGRKDSWRVQVIFRNATIQAANAGRWRQMHKPHVLRARPFLEFDGIRDSHECPICAACNGVVLPADHPWWTTHSPILHHACRCGVLSLSRDQAAEKGVTSDLPGVSADEGFGMPPDLASPPKPWNTSNPPDHALEHAFAEKVADHEQRATHPEVPLKPEHDPVYWEQHYRARYGDAAKQVGHGRALLEKSKELTDAEVDATIRKLWNAGVPGIEGAKDGTKERVAERLLAQHVRSVGGCKFPTQPRIGSSASLIRAINRAEAWWSHMASPTLPLPKPTWASQDGRRAKFVPELQVVFVGKRSLKGSAIHEYAHAIESMGAYHQAGLAFLKARTEGEALVKLRDLLPKDGYSDNEVTRPDKLWKEYMGKDYSANGTQWGSELTEIVPVLAGDVAQGNLSAMLRKDPESVLFLFGWLSGA